MEDYYEYLDSNGITTLYKLIKDDTVALIDSYSVTINGITTTLDTHINDSDIHTPISVIESMVDTKISGLVNSAPETLDTLKELSDALGNDPNFATTIANQIGNKANSVHTHVVKDITDFPTIPTKLSQLENDMGFGTGSGSGDTSDCVHKTGNETIAGNKTFTDKIISNKELHYTDTKYDWSDTSLNTWCDAGNVVWFDKTGNRRMHELVGANGGVWRKACYINESRYFTIDSNKNISYEGISFKFNGKNVAIDENLVHTLGNETITGFKSFTEVLDRRNDVTISTVATATQLVDTNANRCGWIANRMHWSGNYHVHNRHIAYNENSGKELYIDIISSNDGSGGLFVSGTAINRNLTDATSETDYAAIATMGWVNNPATATNVVHRSGDETIAGVKTFSSKIVGNLQGNADSSTKASYLDNYSFPGVNKIYLDWDNQVDNYVGLKVDNTTMGGLITTKNIGSQAANSATYATTQATSDNSTKIATTAWVRTYVDSVAGSNTVGSSVSAYWSNSSNVTATGQSSAGGYYPECYSEYITKTPTVGTIYSGTQLYTVLNAYASATASTTGSSSSPIYVTNNKAQATFSNPIGATGKYLCTTANTVKFRAYTASGSASALGTSSVVNNTSAKSIFIRIE